MVACPPPHRALTAHPEAQVRALLSHSSHILGQHAIDTQQRGRVALAIGTELGQLVKELHRQLSGACGSVELMHRQVVSGTRGGRPGLEPPRQSGDVLRIDREARRRGVAAVACQQVAGRVEGVDCVEARDGPNAAASRHPGHCDDRCRAVEGVA